MESTVDVRIKFIETLDINYSFYLFFFSLLNVPSIHGKHFTRLPQLIRNRMLHLSALKSPIKKVGHVATCMQITSNKTRHVEAKTNFEGGMDGRGAGRTTQTPISQTDYSLLFRQ